MARPRGMRQPRQWKIEDGKIIAETPAIAAVAEEVPVAQLDRRIEQLGRRKERAEARLARIQAELDELIAEEAELTALREQLP